MGIQLHIERLVLDGLPLNAFEVSSFERAFRAQLTTLLLRGALPAVLSNGGAYPRLRANAFEFSSERVAVNAGRQTAQSVHGALRGW
jgi:hypothetical protein